MTALKIMEVVMCGADLTLFNMGHGPGVFFRVPGFLRVRRYFGGKDLPGLDHEGLVLFLVLPRQHTLRCVTERLLI